MAQRIKDEDLPFDVPKFDEDEYVRKELISFKTTVVLFVYTLVVAAVTFVVWRAAGVEFLPLLLVAALFAAALKPIYRLLKIDVSKWKRKEWIGTYLLFFLFWLGFTLLAFNPPFSDAAPPALTMSVNPSAQGAGYPIEFTALVRDNVGYDADSVQFCLHPLPGGATPPEYASLSQAERDACRIDWSPSGDNTWTHRWETTTGDVGTYAWYLEAVDKNGHRGNASGIVRVGDPFTVLTPAPANAPVFDEVTDRLIVRPASGLDLRAVQYEIGNQTYNMDYDRNENQWFTSPDYPGWQHGENSVRILAVEHPKYLDQAKVAGATVHKQGANFTITVDPALPLGSKQQPSYPERPNTARAVTPGLELPAFVAAVAVAVLAARRRA